MQTVLITGAASGIGRDTARLFARAGWQCVLVDHNQQALRTVGEGLPAPASAAHVLRTIDLTDAAQIASLREGTPPLDALLNNAGMSDASNTPLVEQDPVQMGRLLALNLAAPAAVVDACAHLLKPGARIVNVSSGAGLSAIPWRGAYSPSKAGLIAQTQALAAAHPEWCVTVLCPGFVRTELVDALIQAGRLKPEGALGKIPLGRMAQPDEMAQALYFLASTGAAPLSGQTFPVNGGSSVYGGSQPLPPSTLDVLPLDLPLQLEVCGGDAAPWQAVAPVQVDEPHYAACLDLSPLQAAPASLLHAVHAAAQRFAARYSQQASLTVLLPTAKPGDWQTAGDAAAARMLIATLACEWGSRALRINALVVPADIDPTSLHPLLRYACGSAAQFLTGQILVCHSPVSAP
ncbi:SDR family NAD(P)-dependent oxidoreductase [Hydrogenophaga sp.]|uniref:SDR family NAD(P)-dependent oxidoreductase n=1 Tax=Hydrogenophaga sp. TaxID=1904254 RepID=UPI002728E94F|nr:SDR family oxidoreductase [Hydrogenophaga sp.]MDO9436302.1 SDR family oxidoreductase [Hydrogenophaga sp.]